MLDLSLLRDGGSFGGPASPTRLAFLNQSCRTLNRLQSVRPSRFETHFPGLGLLNLAHSLRCDIEAGRVPPIEMTFIDEEQFSNADALIQFLERWLEPASRRIVAASTYTMTLGPLLSLMRRLDPRKYLIVLGGAHTTTSPDVDAAHVVVRGEGGAAMRHILTTVLTDRFGLGPEAQGICYLLDGKKVVQAPATDRSMEHLPPPGFAYDLLPTAGVVYATNILRKLGRRPQVYVCTQSCRARCTFCSTYLIHRNVVARSLDLIRKDLDIIINQLGYDALEFHDDDLMQHPELNGLMDTLAQFKVPWFCYARVDLITDDVAQVLAAAGCRRVFLGIESMQQEKLDYFNKGTTTNGNRTAVEALAAAGVGAIAGFIIGAPDDTVSSVLHDVDAFLAMPLFGLQVSVLSPDPGTVEHYRARKMGEETAVAFGRRPMQKLTPDIERWGADPPVGLPSMCRDVAKAELNRLRRLAFCEFYFREHVWDQLMAGKSAEDASIVEEFYVQTLTETYCALRESDGDAAVNERVAALVERVESAGWIAPFRGLTTTSTP
ncbi:MAG: B12-binding domain-containing radical SAM protein [Gammaproteobacteria bacterium]